VHETDIQNALYRFFADKRHPMTIPNCGADCVVGEADLISITRAHLVHEVEIKTSRSDFLREFETKEEKHEILHAGGVKDYPYGGTYYYSNYFWFAAPEGLLSLDDLPDYAGLLSVTEPRTVSVDRDAPRLHIEKLSDTDRRYIERGLTLRYWQERTT
jgi:hypothetical protein